MKNKKVFFFSLSHSPLIPHLPKRANLFGACFKHEQLLKKHVLVFFLSLSLSLSIMMMIDTVAFKL